MGNERQAHLVVWSGDGKTIDTYQPPLAEEAKDPRKQLSAAIMDATNDQVIPIGVSARISRNDNVVIRWEAGNGAIHESVLLKTDAVDIIFDETGLPVSIKFIGIV